MRKGIAIWDLLGMARVMPTGATVSAAAAHKRAAVVIAPAGVAMCAAVGAATATTSDGFRRIDRVGCELIED